VVIAVCYSGMGEATARERVRLGAEVHGVDIKRSPVDLASFGEVDLRETAGIDAALEAIGGPLDASFYCAGLPQTFPNLEVMKVNFVHMRHWNAQVADRMPNGGALDAAKAMVKISEKRAPLSLAYAKRAVRAGMQMDLASGVEFERFLVTAIYNTADKNEGIGAFLEKREAKFTGR